MHKSSQNAMINHNKHAHMKRGWFVMRAAGIVAKRCERSDHQIFRNGLLLINNRDTRITATRNIQQRTERKEAETERQRRAMSTIEPSNDSGGSALVLVKYVTGDVGG